MGTMKKVATAGLVIGLVVVAGGGYAWYEVNKKIELKKTQIQSVIDQMGSHAKQYGVSVKHNIQVELEKTSGVVELVNDKKESVFKLDYLVKHPMESWFKEQTNTPFEFKTTSNIKELKPVQGGTVMFQGRGTLDKSGVVSVELQNDQDIMLDSDGGGTISCPGQKPEKKEQKEVIRFKGQKVKVNYDPKSRLKVSYTIDKIEMLDMESSKVQVQANNFEYSADQNVVDLILGKYEFSLGTLTVPDATVTLTDSKLSVMTESNKPGFYDVIVGAGVRQGQVAMFSNLGAQVQYSFRGASKKVVDGLLKLTESMGALEKETEKSLGFSVVCLEKMDESTLGEKAGIAKKYKEQNVQIVEQFTQNVKDDVLINGFSTNLDMLRFANQNNYVDMSLQVQLLESKKKELLSLEDFLRWMYVVQLKGEVVQLVAPYVQQAQQLGFPVNIEQDDKGVPNVKATIYYDRLGLKVNGKNAPTMYSQLIQKSLRDADRELKFQNRPPIEVQMPNEPMEEEQGQGTIESPSEGTVK